MISNLYAIGFFIITILRTIAHYWLVRIIVYVDCLRLSCQGSVMYKLWVWLVVFKLSRVSHV
jgi:hypothetical protein